MIVGVCGQGGDRACFHKIFLTNSIPSTTSQVLGNGMTCDFFVLENNIQTK